MGLWDTVVLSIIEGVTEFLPVSSTGHLVLFSNLLHIPNSAFRTSFEIAIQLGAILAVVFLYWRQLSAGPKVITRLAVSFLPIGVLGFAFYRPIKDILLVNQPLIVWAIFLGGIFLIVFEYFYKEKETAIDSIDDLTFPQALKLGLFQAVALIPGVSRSAATIVGGLWLGLRRKTIVDFSFMMAVPTMVVATGYDLLKTAPTFTNQELTSLFIGFTLSFLVALLAMKTFLAVLSKQTFIIFGFYRIIFALIFLKFIL